MSKIKVKILRNIKGVDDGNIHPTQYRENEITEIGDGLFKDLISIGAVEIIENKELKPEDMNKKDLIKFAAEELNIELNEKEKKEVLVEIVKNKLIETLN